MLIKALKAETSILQEQKIVIMAKLIRFLIQALHMLSVGSKGIKERLIQSDHMQVEVELRA